jgi:pyruvate dehydrogenase (quinone)/pyruvate oxidase
VAETTSDILIDIIHRWGVDVIFGLPGDGINGIIEALRKRQEDVRFIQVRHEEAAAFMACGYAKFTGKLGVCLATSGPGGIHLLNGLYDAKLDGQPVLAITGLHYHDLLSTHSQQDVDLDRLFMDVAAAYNVRVMGPAHMQNVAELACRAALGYRKVAHITIPTDIQSESSRNAKRSEHDVKNHTSDLFARSVRIPEEQDLRKAVQVLDAGTKVAILVGQGALNASKEVEQIAELLAAPVIKAMLGKAVIPDDSPYCTGGIGLVGTRPSQTAMEECDTLLIVGSSFPYMEFYPKPGQARGVQIDMDPARIGLRYPIEVGLAGDACTTLRLLIPMLKRHDDQSFLTEAQEGMKEWWQVMESRAMREDKPMKPQRIAWELGKRLRNDAIVCCDSGTIATWWMRQIPAKRGQMHSVSGTLATMACGLPYAVAAQVAHPQRQVVAFVGDGGFTMLMGEFATCVKYNLPVKIFIVKNNTLGQIKWEQMVFLGNPEFGVELHPIDFAGYARDCGGTGFTVEDPNECGAVVEQALNAPGPVIVQALVDPYEPPLPAKITARQAMHFAEALVRGEPNRSRIALTAVSDKVRELI